MFPISPIYADYLKRPDREFIVKATVGSEEYDDTKIVDFSIENSLSLTDGFAIGTAIPSKLTIKLRTNEVIPANARIMPYLSLSMRGMTWLQAQYPWEDMHISWTGTGTDWLPLGEFYVDDRERVNDVWTFTCYDKLVFADVAYVSSLTYPITQRAVFNEICNRLGWTYDSSVVINAAYQIQAGPAGYTMRQVLQYIAAANCASLYIDKAGTVKFKRFTASDEPVFEMTTFDYSSVIQTNPVKTYTRVVVTYNTEDELQYEAGTGDDNHTLFLENPFMTQAMVNNLQATLNGFSYLPLTMRAQGYPQLEQGDVISFEQQEGTSWDETVSTWEDTHIPWDGIVRYKSLILHQVFRFAGGLSMTLEAPSVSEQRSEFIVEGSLTQQVNKLNKDAIKEGKSYYGTTITRTDGWIVEREDHLSKAVFNSDELTFYAQSNKAIWFDVPSRRYKFNGTLEATDGVFSGNLQAAGGTFSGDLRAAGGTFTGTLQGVNGTFSGSLQAASGTFRGTLVAGRVEGGEIIGSYIQGADILGSRIRTAASGDRIELVPDGFTFYDSGNARRVTLGTNPSANISGHTYYNSSGQPQGLIYAVSSEMHVIGNNGLLVGATSGRTVMQGQVHFSGSVTGLALEISQINGLPNQLQSIQNQINSLSYTLNNHRHTVTTANHNHGNNANLPGTGGGTFTTSTP
ncbi:polymer-forming cytoskeletal protein [Paenibacillus amylolyticus]|uniref:polymer-forming cytoskeletal protein n=1 Tax=Paenibacillus amylolyticus TaxID=1451 RepID=UPI0033989FEB